MYYQNPNIEINFVDDHVKKWLEIVVAEVMATKSYTCKALGRPQEILKVAMLAYDAKSLTSYWWLKF